VTGHPRAVVRAKSKRELIYTLARPHMLRSRSVGWRPPEEGLVGLLWAIPMRGPPLLNRIAGSAAGLYATCFAMLRTEQRLWFATSYVGGRLVALGHSQWSVGRRFARWARTSLA
jgi:hypothetical protein